MATQFEKFKSTLFKMFMLDQAELDFGIYRIMNQKKDEIANFLNNVLPKQVKTLLADNALAHMQELQKQLDDIVKQVQALGYDPDTNPKVVALREEIAKTGSSDEMENAVYSHLTTFFSRYYERGDFISLRRYKKDVYAIPYEGEEVKLHWANADQYYIKTGEYFRNYSFKLSDNKKVEFILKDVTTEQNNNLAQNNMERRFAIYEDEPVKVEANTLHLNFTYELYPKATKQDALEKKSFETVKGLIPSDFMELFTLRPTEKDRNRTLLQKHLHDYVARNTFDYFIHKDLFGFLTRELDFYIKNEILMIDDINSRSTEEFVVHLTVIKAIKAVGTNLIQFLSQLEDFQKRLWLKKKFVVQTDYCITLDRIPEELYPEICANDRQREEWISLFAIDEIKGEGMFKEGYSKPLTEKFLHENPFLVLDTALFPIEFKQRLISSIDNLDEQCDGLMINSENFQALQLLQEKYNQQISTIYIDPPYNTDASKIIYKNGYEHSTWISLMESRLSIARNYLQDTGIIELAIDDYELRYINCCMENVFGIENFISNIAIFTNPKGRDQGFVAQAHDYSVIYAKNKITAKTYNFRLSNEELLKKFSKTNKEGNSLRELPLKRTGTGKFREERPYMFFPFLWNKDSKVLSVVREEEYKLIYNTETKRFNDTFLALLIEKYESNGYAVILPESEDGVYLRWRWGYKSCVDGVANGILFCKQSRGKYSVYQYDMADNEFTPKSFWIGERYDASSKGTNLLNKLLPNNPFDYPKSIHTVEDNILLGSNSDGLILDFFAGSGTTGHAVINLNRADGDNGKRKYILVEMGTYFNTVTKPRIQKVIYSEDWNNGKPVSRKGSSHCFKYMRLEQYEDTLNNLMVSQNVLGADGDFYNGFLLGYMLDLDTRDSLFNLKWFENPFDMKLRITRNNETIEERVDLVETFNYLIGLYVNQISYPKPGICTVEGRTRQGKKSLVIWRDCNKINNEQLNDFFRRSAYSVCDNEFDCIYVNGDNNLENLRADEDTWKVVLIEQEFNKQMFNC